MLDFSHMILDASNLSNAARSLLRPGSLALLLLRR